MRLNSLPSCQFSHDRWNPGVLSGRQQTSSRNVPGPLGSFWRDSRHADLEMLEQSKETKLLTGRRGEIKERSPFRILMQEKKH